MQERWALQKLILRVKGNCSKAFNKSEFKSYIVKKPERNLKKNDILKFKTIVGLGIITINPHKPATLRPIEGATAVALNLA